MSEPLSDQLTRVAAVAILLAGLAGVARAEVAAVDLRTDYAPAADFAGVRVRFASIVDPEVVFRADHLALSGRDYATDWVRVAEFDAPLGNYLLTVDLLAGDGEIVARWSTLAVFDTGRFYYADPAKPWGWAEKSVELFTDADGDGTISGGDRLRYTVAAQGLVGRRFTDELGHGLALVAGSVSTTHGLVLEGNAEGDRRVAIVDMAFGDTGTAIVEFEATVLPEVANQGEILVEQGFYTPGSWGGQYASARIATDDPATPAPAIRRGRRSRAARPPARRTSTPARRSSATAPRISRPARRTARCSRRGSPISRQRSARCSTTATATGCRRSPTPAPAVRSAPRSTPVAAPSRSSAPASSSARRRV